ncbi:TetR/AcrR family transcriptional regulator [Pseudonocardia abyssalis]|uniref:TetR/AcrR family transcriptional regulator n=1 Tax=Pseudonocardia abyssalis TaxID=2792008 RepID=A0ABS6UY29_9PSEU|nr:TetR/AcrR family transcriptional regulator [Pseudonocardia abyssalis]MBW0119625.1 TetR/AcrR family transcriptional regulator [Pseudonocardia abyssalis]MBW0137168.1 TetR/AcrR family transcriptional regulator [Pseudonocardia abyssalis]
MPIGTRSARAEATRTRIVDAAAPLFVERGYLDTTMSGLARAAGVAVQTLYLSFGSKAAVLEAVLDADREDHRSGWDPRSAPDGPAVLSAYVEAAAAEVARRHPLDAVLRAAAADPDPAELLDRSRRAALAAHARVVDELADRPGFTTRVSLQRATEMLDALLSPEVYGRLVVGHGWTVPDWSDWTTRHLRADLFP